FILTPYPRVSKGNAPMLCAHCSQSAYISRTISGCCLLKSFISEGSASISYSCKVALSKTEPSSVLATSFHLPSRKAILASCSQYTLPRRLLLPTKCGIRLLPCMGTIVLPLDVEG